MTQRIVIDGDTVTIIEESIVATAPISSIMPHHERRLPVSVGPLPAGCRFITYDKDKKNATLLIERPPTVATIHVHYKSGNGPEEDTDRREGTDHVAFTVALPYMLWSFHGKINEDDYLSIDSAYHWFSPRPIAKLTDQLYAAIMPNVFSGGSICWGATGATEGYGLDRLATLVNEFLTTDFNDHLDPRFPDLYQSYTEWENATKADPLCWQKWNWTAWNDHTCPVSDAIDTSLPPTDYHFDFVIPTPPPTFSLALAREWIRSIPDRQRTIMLAAITHETEPAK